MLAREVRERLKGKIDSDLQLVLEAMAEDIRIFKQSLIEVADVVNRQIDHTRDLQQIMGVMKDKFDKLKTKGILLPDDGSGNGPTH